jgi:ATP-dependent Lon protease
LLPEVYSKMGLEEMIIFDKDVLTFIIDKYTIEPGVRKLKEILFEIVGEINLDILTNKIDYFDKCVFPLKISIDDIEKKYFKDKQGVKHKQIHNVPTVGMINGLWANSLGLGGVIPIQAKMFPSEKFMDLKLTGMQGDVMKESMNVSQTLAWNLTAENKKKEWKSGSIHIHCPEGSVPKDGPSAGTAITCVVYSLLNNLKIKNEIAITGEISLDGTITEIGGLDIKILGGLKCGVKEFIFPEENKKDFDSFMEKYKYSILIKDITFHQVKHITDVFQLIFL